MNEESTKSTRKGYIQFFVHGQPQPGGSKKAIPNKKTGRAQLVDANPKVYSWKQDVATAALAAGVKKLPRGTPVRLDIAFFQSRPNSHYGTGRNANTLKASAPEYPTSKPDRTKLQRSTEDAMKGIAWDDDSQVVAGETVKRYDGMPPGALIEISIAE